jgi:hypothetical protein
MTVSAMHEDVHQGTSEQRQPNQQAQHVGLMLGEQQRASDNQETDQNEPNTGPQGEAFTRQRIAPGMLMHCHPRASRLMAFTLIVASASDIDASQYMRNCAPNIEA